MDFSLPLVGVAGAAALLLWGTHMVRTGVQRAFGPRLRAVLGGALKGRLRAFLAGLGVTAALQSSTATGLMTAGFVAGGLVDLVPALAVMLGANVGTTLIAQAFSFDVAAFSPALVLVGYVLFRRAGSPIVHDLGRVFIGFGLMLLALHQIIALAAPYEDAPSLRMFLGAVASVPLLAAFLAAAATFALHSSVAVVLLVMSFAARGVVPPETAFAMILGANFGTALNPVLEGPAGDDAAARRVTIGNLLNRALGVAAGLALLAPASRLMVTLEPDPARAAADFHTLFNVALAALFLPLLDPFAALLRRLIPERISPADPSRPLYLDANARETPIVALGAAAREALRLVDALEAMLTGALDALVQGDRRQIADARRLDDVLDRLNGAIKAYLSSLDHEELSRDDHRRMTEILVFSTNLEQAGDVVDRSLLPHAAKRLKRGLALPKESEDEIRALMERLVVNLRASASLLMTEDARAARLLAAEKAAFRDAETRATGAHFEAMRRGRLDAIETSSLYLDLLRDMKMINSHIVSAAAYPVLERTGDLLPTRLASSGE